MKCDEIGRWFIDDVVWCERAVVNDAVFDVSRPVSCWWYAGQDGCGSGEEANLVRRRCDQMLMWDTGYEVPVPVYEDCPWREDLVGYEIWWDVMKSEARDAHRWITSVPDLSSRVCNRSRCGWVRLVSWVGVPSLGIHQWVEACKLELKSPH